MLRVDVLGLLLRANNAPAQKTSPKNSKMSLPSPKILLQRMKRRPFSIILCMKPKNALSRSQVLNCNRLRIWRKDTRWFIWLFNRPSWVLLMICTSFSPHTAKSTRTHTQSMPNLSLELVLAILTRITTIFTISTNAWTTKTNSTPQSPWCLSRQLQMYALNEKYLTNLH